MLWSRALSWCPCSQGPWKMASGSGWDGRPLQEVLSGVWTGWQVWTGGSRQCNSQVQARAGGSGRPSAGLRGAGWSGQDGLRAG